MSDITKLRKLRAEAIVDIETRITLKKYHLSQLQTIETELRQFNKIIIECNQKETDALENLHGEKTGDKK